MSILKPLALILFIAFSSFITGKGSAAVTVKNPNLKTLLFYTCVTKQVGNQCEEGFTLDQADIATGGFSSNLTTIAGGAKLNMTTLYAVHDTFFQNGAGLRHDWKEAWSTLQIQIEPFIQNKTIVGFFIGDELFPGKISLSDFTTALNAISTMKVKYPWLVNWENEGSTSWIHNFKNGIPKELDIISLDDYYMWGDNGTDSPQSQVDGHRHFYKTSIYPLLSSHQKVYLVPGSFATHDKNNSKYPGLGNKTYCYNNSFQSCDQYMADQANAFAKWAYEDERIAGIAPWHWDSRDIGIVTPYKEVGVVDMPLTKEAWKNIGNEIRKNNMNNNNSDDDDYAANIISTIGSNSDVRTPKNLSCETNNIDFMSYHIHILFPPSNKQKTIDAMNLQHKFIKNFRLENKSNCSMVAGDPAPWQVDICSYEVDWVPEGPFLTAQYSFFIPTNRLQDTSQFMLTHKGNLDMLIHPNTGCEKEDHTNWASWSGTKWEIDTSVFSCEYIGCVPKK
jgi:aromatic ring-cleaving dioxygenase